jgi:hypothetical protein
MIRGVILAHIGRQVVTWTDPGAGTGVGFDRFWRLPTRQSFPAKS